MPENDDLLPPPWTVERSRQVIRDEWISLRADSCRTAEGVAIDPFYVLEFPDWVQIVAIDVDDRIVLVEQYRHGFGRNLLELPCGGIDAGDADELAAGRRELEEETGYRSDDWRYIGALAPNPSNQTNRCHVLLAQNAQRTGLKQDNPTERIRVSCRPIPEVIGLARDGTIVQAMHVAALALALTEIGRWR